MKCPHCGAEILASSTGRIWCAKCRNGTKKAGLKMKR